MEMLLPFILALFNTPALATLPSLLNEGADASSLQECQGPNGFQNCKHLQFDPSVLHNDDVLINGEEFSKSFDDSTDLYTVFKSVADNSVAAIHKTVNGTYIGAFTDGQTLTRIILSCGNLCQFSADPIMPPPPPEERMTSKTLASSRADCTVGDRIDFFSCYLQKIGGGCTFILFYDYLCPNTCGNVCCGDSNFENCAALKGIIFNWGCTLFGGNYFCRQTCGLC